MAAILGAAAIALGAFGAHGLEEILVENDSVDNWETASRYHLVHAILLYALAWLAPARVKAWWTLFAGTVIFSGTLYVLSVTGIKILGAITPIGGVALIAGWVALAVPCEKTE